MSKDIDIYDQKKLSFEDEINALTKNLTKNLVNPEQAESIPNEAPLQEEEPRQEYQDSRREPIEIVNDEEPDYQNLPPELPDAPPDEDFENQKIIEEKRKLKRLQREKFQLAEKYRQAEEEKGRVIQENEYLRQQQAISSNASLYHHENSIKLQQQTLKESLKRANDMQDMDLVADIQMELGKIGAEIDRIGYHKAQSAMEAQQYQHYQNAQQQLPYAQQEPMEAPVSEDTIEWAKKNPWLIPNSKEYDEDKVMELNRYVSYLDRYLADEGRHMEFQTPSYFDAIDKHMTNMFGGSMATPQQVQRAPAAPRPQTQVAPVRRSGSGSYNGTPTKVTLTTGQKDFSKMLQRMKIPGGSPIKPEDYAREVLKYNIEKQKAFETGDVAYLRHHLVS